MRWQIKDKPEWQPVPFALVPFSRDGTVYWLERPPYERRAKEVYAEWIDWQYREAAHEQ